MFIVRELDRGLMLALLLYYGRGREKRERG